MNIEQRIDAIMNKMEKFSDKELQFTCGKFPPIWNKPLPEKDILDYENKNNITLPEDYKTFITKVANGGTQPFYGFYGLFSEIQKNVAVNEKFLYTVTKPLNIAELSDEEYDKLWEEEEINFETGYLYLCHEGCGMYSILIVNTDDKDTYGTVWFFDVANDCGIFPLINPVNKTTMTFLDWLEYYVDKTLSLEYSEYFSYGQLAGVIE